MTEALFFDSYALVEMLRGNPEYSQFRSIQPVLTKLNLFEVCYVLLREGLTDDAEAFLINYAAFASDFDNRIILESAALRLKLKGRRVSMADCVGYVVSQHLGIRFLTGDEQFKDLPNVEFVK